MLRLGGRPIAPFGGPEWPVPHPRARDFAAGRFGHRRFHRRDICVQLIT
jgi:hypothetical protein